MTAERELLMAASYGKYNPARLARALLFKRAIAAMPVGQELSKDLWPVLYQLYYEKKPSRPEKRALKKIYHEGREQARAAAAQKVAHAKKRVKSNRRVA